MSRHIRVGGAYREILQRYNKVGSTWVPTQQRFKKVSGAYQETWPLVPGPVTAVSHSTPYQNDRIEYVINWTAPTTGAAVADYVLQIRIFNPGGTVLNYAIDIVVGPSTSYTWVNNGSGIQHLAGYPIQTTIVPRSAGPRNGTTTGTGQRAIAQLPPPDVVPTLNIGVSSYNLSTTWTNMTGNRVTGYSIHVYISGSGPYVYNFSKGTAAWNGQPWDPATVNGGQLDVYIIANGPGGSSSSFTHQGGYMPAMPSFGGLRFYQSQLINDITQGAGAAGSNAWWENVSGAPGTWNFFGTAGSGRLVLPGSESFARDNATYYRFIYQPIGGPGNAWTGRVTATNYALKLPNPYWINPEYSETWYSERGWFGLPIKQGASSAGERTGYYFYGYQISNAFSPSRTGYDLTVGATGMIFGRTNQGGLGQAVPIRLWLHGAPAKPGSPPGLAGGVDFASVARNQSGAWDLPGDWGNQLAHAGYYGTAIYYPNTGIIGGLGASAQYIEAFGHDNSVFGVAYGGLGFNHDA